MKLPVYKASWLGIARIAFWTVFFIWLAGTFIPAPSPGPLYLGPFAINNVRLVATIPEDPRYVTFPPRQEGTNIYWVMDSTVAVHHHDPDNPHVDIDTKLVPTYVMEEMGKIASDKKFGFDVNAQPYLGGVEFYSAAAAAIAAKPDMIVLSVSPFNLFTSHEIIQRPQHLNRASALWAQHSESWPWLVTIASPANNLWGLLGQRLTLIRDASLYKGYLDRWEKQLPGATVPEKADNIRTLGGVGRRLVFWFCEGVIKDGCPDYFYKGGKNTDMLVWYREKLRVSDIEGNGLTADAWNKSLEILKDSGIPVLIYKIPVGNFLGDGSDYKNLPKFEAILKASAEKYAGTNVHIIPRLPREVESTLEFRIGDSEHLAAEGKYPAYLAEQIWTIIKDGGKK